MNRSDILTILDQYNEFLLKEGYCDSDIVDEPPTAIDQFMQEYYPELPALDKCRKAFTLTYPDTSLSTVLPRS